MKPSKSNTMKLGLSSLLFPKTPIEDIVKFSAKLGAECVEIIYDVPHFPPNYDQRKLSDVKELLDVHGLLVSVHGSFWDLNPASHHRELQKLTLNQLRRSIDACRALEGEIVVLHFGRCPVPEAKDFLEGAKRRYRRFIEKCLPYARERGVTLALENAGGQPATYPSTIEELKQLVLELEGAKIAFDIGHAHLAERRAGGKVTGPVIAKAIEGLREHLVHVHVHDNRGKDDDHLPPGDGDINFKPVVEALRAINYGGLLIAELWNPKHPLETGRKGMKKLRNLFKTI
ncbi:MAG: sugar phosphate isomerase/epimerase family protein [Candidatus Hadarchaeaceae archaeon]